MTKRFLVIVGIMAVLGIAYSYTQHQIQNVPKPQTTIVNVSATFYPLAELAKQIGGEYVEIHTVISPGVEPHDFEPTPRDIARIHEASLFLANGNGIDAWADSTIETLRANRTSFIRMSDVLRESHATSSDSGTNQVTDPHFWLDPILLQTETQAITEALIRIDPTHREAYIQNRDNYLAKLTELDRAYRTGLSSCEHRVIISSHQTFHYLARRYDFETRSVLGMSPDEEPSAERIAALVDDVRERSIPTIFTEALEDPRPIETIAQETGASIIELYPLERITDEQIQNGESIISLMQKNLERLTQGLLCNTQNPSSM